MKYIVMYVTVKYNDIT